MHPAFRTIAFSLIACGLACTMPSFGRAEDVKISLLYPNDRTTAGAHTEIRTLFEKENPGVKIEFLAPAQSYEEISQKVIRGAMIDDMPDVIYQGLSLLRILVDRDLAISLDPFIVKAGGADKLGYDQGMLRIGEQKGQHYGIPFAVSTPVIYVNLDLLKAAGVESEGFPKSWDEISALGKRLADPAKGVTGFYYQWDITANWMFQSLVFANGGRMMDEKETKVAFDQPAGMKALETLEAFSKAGMPNLPSSQARTAFIAGKLAIFADSSSNLGKATTEIGDRFKFQTFPFPVPSTEGRLPAGGNLVVMLTRNPEKQAAAWKYIQFATGPVGQTIMAKYTGYLPSNSIAIRTPEMLGNFYKARPNYQTSIAQVPMLTGWYAFPGPNSLRIIDIIRGHLESVVTGKTTAAKTMPRMVSDVQQLLE
jgi:multiple sugar transport system substrate-binding protein